ncbi:hypothetical protein [Alkalicoccus chagannorensis]|uniref:hypothetical protein n=1 Tax=Alkalicoccus chagannorensis TaxID=427072 RepID=UPI00047C5428|nr:hypothetical protein [Alkalicoccus chagannorensis]
MKDKRVKKQAMIGFVLFSIIIIASSSQIILTTNSFIKGISLIAVVSGSIGVGMKISNLKNKDKNT